jgi:hypothetical protein
MQLLKFATLFLQRYSPCPATPPLDALMEMRHRNTIRAEAWLQRRQTLTRFPGFDQPLAVIELQHNRRAILSDVGLNDEVEGEEFFGTPYSVSLIDLLPMFMDLSATKVHLANWNINPTWMRLAAEFMLQAALEQYRIFGAQGTDSFDTAFAWGWTNQKNSRPDSPSEDSIVNEMFRDDTGQHEVLEWTEIRNEFTATLNATKGSITDHLTTISVKHPLGEFEGTIISFLEGMLKSFKLPVLVQMELGQLEGFSRAETTAFKSRLGWV